MKRAILSILASSVVLVPAALATTKRCINTGGCQVVETLSSGLQITHRVAYNDEFESSSGNSYVWSGGSSDWEKMQ